MVIHAPEEGVLVQRGMVVSVQHARAIMQGEVGRVLNKTNLMVRFEVTEHSGGKWELVVPPAWACAGPPELESDWDSTWATVASGHVSFWMKLAALFMCGSMAEDV